MRVNAEGSGLLSGFIHNERLDRYLYRFIKIDGDIRQTYQIRRTAFAWRFFSGVGYEIINPRNPEQKYLPFFKSYFAGGPNSMRGWQLRRLGPGSTKKSFARNIAPDRFGDIQLELNGEYRFFVADIKGVLLNSALFTDIGNIWFLRKNPDFLNGEFKLSRLGEDIAIAAGTGLRVDFGPFLVRVDYGYRVKNPNVEKQWFNSLKLSNGQIQIGVTYPF
jgi:outer membrane protein assembly factor BamA